MQMGNWHLLDGNERENGPFTIGEVQNFKSLEPGVEDGQPAGGSWLQERGIFRDAPIPIVPGRLFTFWASTASKPRPKKLPRNEICMTYDMQNTNTFCTFCRLKGNLRKKSLMKCKYFIKTAELPLQMNDTGR